MLGDCHVVEIKVFYTLYCGVVLDTGDNPPIMHSHYVVHVWFMSAKYKYKSLSDTSPVGLKRYAHMSIKCRFSKEQSKSPGCIYVASRQRVCTDSRSAH